MIEITTSRLLEDSSRRVSDFVKPGWRTWAQGQRPMVMRSSNRPAWGLGPGTHQPHPGAADGTRLADRRMNRAAEGS